MNGLDQTPKPANDVSLRNEMGARMVCAASGCTQPVNTTSPGRPARFCSGACRVRAHRGLRTRPERGPVTVEVDHGSASSRGRPPERAWMVRIRRADRSVIVTIGLTRPAADRLAEQLIDILGATPTPAPQ